MSDIKPRAQETKCYLVFGIGFMVMKTEVWNSIIYSIFRYDIGLVFGYDVKHQTTIFKMNSKYYTQNKIMKMFGLDK